VPGVHLVAAYAHESQAVVDQLRTEGKGQNWRRPKRCWGVTGDSLLTQREVSERIVRGGGDYLLPVKDNQPSLRSDLDRALSLMGGPRVRPPGCATLDGAGVVPT